MTRLLRSISLLVAFAAVLLSTWTISSPAHADRNLVLGVVLEPPHLDPTAGAAAAIDEIVYANVFEGLTRIGPRGEVLPALASHWDISNDGATYTFHLRQGVRFHNGTPFTAGHVKFSVDRAMSDDSTNAQKGLFSAIDTVDVIDDHAVRIQLKHPQGAFLYNMAWGDAIIVAPDSADTNSSMPVGTGPFAFDRWTRGSSISLIRNEDYWGEQVSVSRVEFRFIPDAAAATAALLSGDIHAFPSLPVTDDLGILEADPRFVVVVGATEGETILAMNNAREPMNQLKVRQAISHALDRDEIILGASGGRGVPIGSHFSPGHEAHLDLTDRYPHDLDRAEELLAEAGLAGGFSATLVLPPQPYARSGGEIIASQLRRIGIELAIIPLEWAQWLDQVFTNSDYDMTIIAHTEPNDIDIYSREGYYFNYNNPEFVELIQTLDGTSDEEARRELLQQAQRMLADDAVNGFLFQLPKVGVWDYRLEGLWENYPIQANDLTAVRWRP